MRYVRRSLIAHPLFAIVLMFPKRNTDTDTTTPPKKRSLARQVAFQVLFQEDLNPGCAGQFGDEYVATELPADEALRTFAKTLINGTRLHQSQIDDQIRTISQNWTVERMTCMDRNILRMAIFEIQEMRTPYPVVVSEAVELARQFGTADSTAFVNGILGKLK